ncbi:MAG: bifunctional precorrin-2 dehydrogenase/sirohydrochlorin ferrochelatase [Nitrospiraceae bacterium]|nr:bifunctional precorrin-2 dehydrogenase/sirohydrochlorin ferrochelatase [Nitrospiraceae bacterium]
MSLEGAMRYYPAFLDLKGRRCVVVGGGKVARRKVSSLLKAGAQVTVVSPALVPALSRLKEKGVISHIRGRFTQAHLKGAFLVFSATDEAAENERVARAARRLNIPVNVADLPELCSFIVPSVVDRGQLLIAVSTSGASPAMSRSIRLELEGLYGKQFARYLRALSRIRQKALRELPPGPRKKLFKSMASDDIIRTIRSGKIKVKTPADLLKGF